MNTPCSHCKRTIICQFAKVSTTVEITLPCLRPLCWIQSHFVGGSAVPLSVCISYSDSPCQLAFYLFNSSYSLLLSLEKILRSLLCHPRQCHQIVLWIQGFSFHQPFGCVPCTIWSSDQRIMSLQKPRSQFPSNFHNGPPFSPHQTSYGPILLHHRSLSTIIDIFLILYKEFFIL